MMNILDIKSRLSVGLANKQNKHVLVAATFQGGPRLPKQKYTYEGYHVKISFEYPKNLLQWGPQNI